MEIFIMFVGCIASGICMTVAMRADERNGIADSTKQAVVLLISLSVVAGVLLNLIADNREFDIYRYEKLTDGGMSFYIWKIVGAAIIVDALLAGTILAVKDIKSALFERNRTACSQSPVMQERREMVRQAPATPPIATTPQGRIPAWQRVEMEEQAKAQAAREQAQKNQ